MSPDQNQKPEKPVFGFCSWCSEPLDSGEFFVSEMERSAWEEGTEGLPEHEAVFLLSGEPVPSCKRCRESMIQHYEGVYVESKFERFLFRSAVVMFVGFLIMFTATFVFDLFDPFSSE